MRNNNDINKLTGEVIGAAIEVHKALGPGLLESVYEKCFCRELELRDIFHESQKDLPVNYKGLDLDCGYRMDLLVEGSYLLEIKSVEAFAPIHFAQILTYSRIADLRYGLLLNFNVLHLKNGIKRVVNGY